MSYESAAHERDDLVAELIRLRASHDRLLTAAEPVVAWATALNYDGKVAALQAAIAAAEEQAP